MLFLVLTYWQLLLVAACGAGMEQYCGNSTPSQSHQGISWEGRLPVKS